VQDINEGRLAVREVTNGEWNPRLGACTDTWVEAECLAVFVSPWLDSSRLDTASGPRAALDVGGRRGETGIAQGNVRCDVEFIYNMTVALPLMCETTALGIRRKLPGT